MERWDSTESQLSILEASGQSSRFFPVCWVYLDKASQKRASKACKRTKGAQSDEREDYIATVCTCKRTKGAQSDERED